ncbi:TIGR01777 family oxidoreductase [Paenibacillus sp. KQZ6P-2]|uniref:TIGR01777 family oxidoreductase n=1 Tax=Paenibacillus mangrovi TaxID=2931978 RepID=A0A9X1WPZ4_9BACL|nr:TIGR01777 family oxidoreductase [Paenibacillus mangrovi]MCJ8013267.1 TIGR01777 family oxidoreductase [Paenibacillus mangrovi]
MKRKVVIAGGTGFIGTYLEEQFKRLEYEVLIISRKAGHIAWDDTDGIRESLEHAEMLINLAGKSVNCRYHAKNKAEIMNSRTETTDILGQAALACEHPPGLWINSSTATIYRHAEDRPMTEAHGEIGSGFSVEVAKAWERSFFSFSLPHTRQIALRIAIVLGRGGGVMIPYRNLVRFGLGGIQGPGSQKFSWIHLDDILGIILFLRDHPELSGVFNVSSPNPVDNRELMQQLREVMKMPFGLPSPAWMLELGARVIQTETELILKSRWVIPERLEQAGYRFKYPTLRKALCDIIS